MHSRRTRSFRLGRGATRRGPGLVWRCFRAFCRFRATSSSPGSGNCFQRDRVFFGKLGRCCRCAPPGHTGGKGPIGYGAHVSTNVLVCQASGGDRDGSVGKTERPGHGERRAALWRGSASGRPCPPAFPRGKGARELDVGRPPEQGAVLDPLSDPALDLLVVWT